MPSIPPLSSSRAQRIEAKYNVVTDFPNLGLHSASAKGDIGLVQYALTHGQPVNGVLDGIVPLHAACSGGSAIIVTLLLDYGADVNVQRLPRRYSDRNKDGTIIGSSGSTPLHFAAANGHIHIVNILLSRGADPRRADKHGTTPEALARAFGHDQVVSVLRDWVASRHSPDHHHASSSQPLQHSSSGATITPVPPSPTRSRKLHVKRSLENLLSRKAAQLSSSTIADNANGGTPGSTMPSDTIDGQSNVRRPSLPFIFERTPAQQQPSKTSPSGRPRSAGQDADGKPGSTSTPSDINIPPANSATVPASGQRRLVSKISLLNIFKKSDHQSSGHSTPNHTHHHHAGEGLGGAFGASSPNLLTPLQPPADIILTRPRSSTEDLRVMNESMSRISIDRDSIDDPNTAPAQQSSFFHQSHRYSPGRHRSNQRQPATVPLPRGARSSSHSRAQELRRRADSSATLSSSSSSIDSHPISSSPNTAYTASTGAIQKGRPKKDRSASEGAGMNKRSPLATEWIKNEDGTVSAKELPGVIDDDVGEEDDDYDEESNHAAVSWSTIRPSDLGRTPPAQTPTRPSLVSHSNAADSTSPGGSNTHVAGHFRTNSNQSIKALRFDPTVDIVPSNHPPSAMNRHMSSPLNSPTSPSRSNSISAYPNPSPSSPLVRKTSSQKPLRSSSSVGSLQWSRKNSFGRLREEDQPQRAGSFEGEHPSQILDQQRSKSPDQHFSGDERAEIEDEDDADRHGEGADSVGEPIWKDPGRTTFGRTGSNSSGQRPSLASLSSSLAMTPATPRSTNSLTSPNPDTAGTSSSGGRPWALPSATNSSQSSLPHSPMSATSMLAPNTFSALSQTGGSPGQANGKGDSRLRGASVSSSMSTDTNTNSTSSVINPTTSSGPTSEASNSSVRLTHTTSRSPSTSTIGRNAGRSSAGDLPSPSFKSPYHHQYYDIEGDSDSDSSTKEGYISKSTGPLSVPVLLRSVNSHAQAHALVEKAEKEILDLADLPPDSAGLSGPSLSAQLAAYGESLAIERRFARGEAQKWVNRSALDDDSDEDEDDELDMEKDKYPRGPTEAFVAPQNRRKTSGGSTSMMNMSIGGVADRGGFGTGTVGRSASIARRGHRGRNLTKQPPQINTTVTNKSTPIRTTPSNVGPPAKDLKNARLGDDHYSLNHLVLGGIEITQTLPTPTDSPLSVMHNGSSPPDLKVSSRDAGPLGGGGREIEMADGSSSGTAGEGDSPESPPFTAPPLVRSTTPDVFVSDYQPVPLSRVNTLPTNSGPSYPSESPTSGHARTNSAGTAGFGPVLMGPPDYIPPRSESRMKQRLTGLKAFVQTLKGKS